MQRIITCLLVSAMSCPGLTGCAFIGGAMESYYETSSHSVAAEYENMKGKNFAVIVTGDRVLQGSYPTLFPRISTRITERLIDPEHNVGASGVVPTVVLMEFQLTNPSWAAWGYQRLAEELGVERLVIVEIFEYRLNEIGNQYLWDGLAAARVGVVEADGVLPNEFVFTKNIQVAYPSEKGVSQSDMTDAQVRAGLEQRFVDRVSWLFYEHDEPYRPDY